MFLECLLFISKNHLEKSAKVISKPSNLLDTLNHQSAIKNPPSKVGTQAISHLFRSESVLEKSSGVLGIDKSTDQTAQSTDVESCSLSPVPLWFIAFTDIKWEEIPAVKFSYMTEKFLCFSGIKDIFSQKIDESPNSWEKLFPFSISHKTHKWEFTKASYNFILAIFSDSNISSCWKSNIFQSVQIHSKWNRINVKSILSEVRHFSFRNLFQKVTHLDHKSVYIPDRWFTGFHDSQQRFHNW